jgi:intein-encoded DNA endonuclease-like protein
MAHNFQTGSNKIKLLMECESVIQIISFGNALMIRENIRSYLKMETVKE